MKSKKLKSVKARYNAKNIPNVFNLNPQMLNKFNSLQNKIYNESKHPIMSDSLKKNLTNYLNDVVNKPKYSRQFKSGVSLIYDIYVTSKGIKGLKHVKNRKSKMVSFIHLIRSNTKYIKFLLAMEPASKQSIFKNLSNQLRINNFLMMYIHKLSNQMGYQYRIHSDGTILPKDTKKLLYLINDARSIHKHKLNDPKYLLFLANKYKITNHIDYLSNLSKVVSNKKEAEILFCSIDNFDKSVTKPKFMKKIVSNFANSEKAKLLKKYNLKKSCIYKDDLISLKNIQKTLAKEAKVKLTKIQKKTPKKSKGETPEKPMVVPTVVMPQKPKGQSMVPTVVMPQKPKGQLMVPTVVMPQKPKGQSSGKLKKISPKIKINDKVKVRKYLSSPERVKKTKGKTSNELLKNVVVQRGTSSKRRKRPGHKQYVRKDLSSPERVKKTKGKTSNELLKNVVVQRGTSSKRKRLIKYRPVKTGVPVLSKKYKTI